MTDEKTVKAIAVELTKAYLMAHRNAPQATIDVVAASIAETVPAITAENAHAVFVRAMQVEAVPSVTVLMEAVKNYLAESYTQVSALPLIENRDPRAAWLPSDMRLRKNNMMTAIRNLSAAISDREYSEYCKVHLTSKEKRGDKEVPVYVNESAALAFDRPKKAMLKDLYRKYWRLLPVAKGYPADAPLNHGLTPPTVPQFRVMLEHEAKVNGYTA